MVFATTFFPKCYIIRECRLTTAHYRGFQAEDDGCFPLLDQPRIVITILTFHALTDILVFSIPIHLLTRLKNLTPIQKLSAMALFALGFIDLIFMAVNVWLNYLTNKGISKDFIMTGVFFTLEPAWAIVVTCCPAFRVVIVMLYEKVTGVQVTRSGTSGSEVEEISKEGVVTKIESCAEAERTSRRSSSQV